MADSEHSPDVFATVYEDLTDGSTVFYLTHYETGEKIASASSAAPVLDLAARLNKVCAEWMAEDPLDRLIEDHS